MPAPGFFFRDGEESLLVAALHPEVVAAGTRLSVSERDEMFMAFYYGRGESIDLALHLYLSSGERIWQALRAALERRFGGLERVGSLLDFAAGYGRVTRFMATDLPPERVWAAEIDPRAVAFQEETFGVHGLLTTARPEDFAPGRSFDAIVVSSLFTHLPEKSFHGWLARLLALVAPGGLLALSVHDASLAPAEVGNGGFLFRPESESGSLAGEDYGSTWVSEEYVREAIRAAGSESEKPEVEEREPENRELETRGTEDRGVLDVERIPRGLAGYQDLYLVAVGGPPLAAGGDLLALLQGGVEGHVEHCRLSAAGRLELAGWALDRASRWPVRRVAALLDGAPAAATGDFADRPEVAAEFPGDAGSAQGWRLAVPLPPRCDLARSTLRLVAEGADGRETRLAEASLQAMISLGAHLREILLAKDLATQREELARAAERLRAAQAAHGEQLARRDHAIARLEAEIAAMRQSRFWKLRDRWFAVKRFLRLTTER